MRAISRTLAALSIAGLSTAGVLGTAAVASAADVPSLHLDQRTYAPGEVVELSADCAGDGLNFIGSAAFAPTGHDGPYTGNGGVATITAQRDGVSRGHAVIAADTEPGDYHVGQRCSGGNAGGVMITVTQAP